MKFPFAQMVRRASNRRRKFVVLPSIGTTTAQADDLARLYVGVLRVWQVFARDRILPAYARTLEQDAAMRDSVSDIQIAVSAAEGYAVQAVFGFGQAFEQWGSALERRHLSKVIANLKYATNVDASTMLGSEDAAMTLQAALARNVALVRDVSDKARAAISDSVFRGLQARTPMRDVAREISDATGIQRARALRIASDQTVKLSAALDQERMEQLEITEFQWQHSRKKHPRQEHIERDGKVYRWDDPRLGGDLPGRLPFCGCKAKGVVRLEAEGEAPAEIPAPAAAPAPAFAYQSFTPLKSVDEAVKWMKSNVAKHVTISKGTDLHGLNEIAHATQEVAERFDMPPAFFIGDPTGITFNANGRRLRIPFSSRAAAVYAPEVDAYAFRKLGADDKKLRAIQAEQVKTTGRGNLIAAREMASRSTAYAQAVKDGLEKMETLNWVASGSARSTAYHELGHRLHLKFHKDEINAVLNAKTIGAEGWPKLVSNYSATNMWEFVAESFALYMEGEAQHFRIYPPLLKVFKKLDKAAK